MRSRRAIVKLLHALIKSNRIPGRSRKTLKGSLGERTDATTRAANYLSALRLEQSQPREQSPMLNPIVAELRRVATDRIQAGQRLRAIERLMRIANIGSPRLYAEPIDQRIEQLLRSSVETVEPERVTSIPKAETEEERLARIDRELGD